MGVTIHYAGRLRLGSDQMEFLDLAEKLATQRGWRHERLHDESGNPSTGFVVFPHPDCERLEFVFDQRGRFSGWVKTHFAGPENHMEVIEFLRQVKALLGKFGVRDEGEYWVTANEETLRSHFDTINRVIRKYVEEDPSVRVGVHEPNGRITDLIR